MRYHLIRSPFVFVMAAVACGLSITSASAQAGLFRNAAVGGVSIDANGVVKNPTQEEMQGLRAFVEGRLAAVPADMDTELGLRRISLRQLEAVLQEGGHQDLSTVPDEIKYLAGLQRVQYLLIYPEHQDIVLVGPGEGWRINEQGHVVGKSTGRPVIQLEDLLAAFRTVRQGNGLIQCSIDPTEDGIRTMRKFVKQQKRFSPQAIDGIANALGPQQVTVSGVSESSHFARVLVAADYRMKRLAMQLDESPLPEMPSFLQMLAKSRFRLTNMMPRWWLACEYEPMARSNDGLAWELRGPGVQIKTEDDLVTDDGTVQNSGRQNPIAAKWANNMTRNYDQLSVKEAVFAQLRNLMDLSVLAALIEHEQLTDRAGLSLPILFGTQAEFAIPSWNPPKSVATECSFVKRGRDYLITASGGVEIDPFRYASQSQVSPRTAEVRKQTAVPNKQWWW